MTENAIFCLYASPIPKKGTGPYTRAENAIHLPKLLNVYKNLGFISSKEDPQVMYQYA